MIPDQYLYLMKENGPRMLREGLRLYGTMEVKGNGDNPTIIAWAKEVGGETARVYTRDAIPWCGLYMAVVAKRAGKSLPENPLLALSWSAWGKPIKDPELGDAVIFVRDGGGHVGIYVGEDLETYHILGGNQADQVNITRIRKRRMYGARRPYYDKQPSNVRRIYVGADGPISVNEQ